LREGAAASNNAAESDDLELIRSVAQGDRRGFETLYYRYAPRLGRYLFRLLRQREAVEEAINDVMMVVWQSAARFEATSRLSTWNSREFEPFSIRMRFSTGAMPVGRP
jgi:RNA polymerase sigma-70 factor (ECF subfamily)